MNDMYAFLLNMWVMKKFDEAYESVACPKCGHVFYYQPEMYEEGEALQCPDCGETFAQPAEE